MTVPPAKITVHMKKAWVLSYPLSGQQDSDAQADLSLRWLHSHFVGFVMRQLIYILISAGMFVNGDFSS